MTKKYAFKKGFTLAEVMIVLTVIGLLTAILLPVARQSMPDENLMKFKKAHNTLGTVIRELVTSDKYYLDGDLGVRSNGNRLIKSDINDRKYLCLTIGDIISAKEINCSDSDIESLGSIIANKSAETNTSSITEFYKNHNGAELTAESLLYNKERVDEACSRNVESNIYRQIITNDGVWYYDNAPGLVMGVIVYDGEETIRLFSPPNIFPANLHDSNGMDVLYKVVCIDIDGIPEGATRTDCINECPFGYGIRADGKILTGARATEWLERDVNEE